MKLPEYQSKKLLREFALQLTEPAVVDRPEAAAIAATAIAHPVMVKAQTPFGGRGKLGAVKRANSPEEASKAAKELLGMVLRGHVVKWVSVEQLLSVSREFYAGVAWDTRAKRPVALLSDVGGVDVEDVESRQMSRRTFDPRHSFPAYVGREMAVEVGLIGKTMVAVGEAITRLATAFVAVDATLVEINPLVETNDAQIVGVDARVELDDDAAFRHAAQWAAIEILEIGPGGRSLTELERESQRIDKMDHRGVAGRVVEFDGDLALLIGGGGGSLTVFDAIKRYGGNPANYCEVGGNPTEEKVAALVALLLSKPGVRKLAVIMNVVSNTRADVMARGILNGLERAGREPADTISVFRVPGSWENESRELLCSAGVEALGREVSLDEAARLAVERMEQHVA